MPYLIRVILPPLALLLVALLPLTLLLAGRARAQALDAGLASATDGQSAADLAERIKL